MNRKEGYFNEDGSFSDEPLNAEPSGWEAESLAESGLA
jgi:hypothetical protein